MTFPEEVRRRVSIKVFQSRQADKRQEACAQVPLVPAGEIEERHQEQPDACFQAANQIKIHTGQAQRTGPGMLESQRFNDRADEG